jgi:acyl-CoA thioesterase
MAIEQISAKRFRSLAGAPYGNFVNRNGEPRARAFGGHVYAQAAYATSKTVDPGFVIHVSHHMHRLRWHSAKPLSNVYTEYDWILYRHRLG